MRIQRFAVALAAALALSQAAPAQPAARARQGLNGIPAVKNFLTLSDQQIQQLTALTREEQGELRPVREQIRDKAAALNTARRAENPNATAVGLLVLELQRLRDNMRAIGKGYQARALALLDDAQREKAANLEQLTRRAALTRGAAAGAAALNLIQPLPTAGARERATP